MTERIGLVLHVFDDRTAEVMTDRKSACGGCEDSRSCKSCLSGENKVVAVVRNEPCARAGDLVVVEQTKGALWSGAALFYVLPVIGLIAGAFAGGILADMWKVDESGLAAAFGMAGFVLCLIVLVVLFKTPYARTRWAPKITKIVGSGKTISEARRACCGS